MVSKAREDLPDPETPVTTVKVLCGISKSIFLRLWTRAPRTTMLSVAVDVGLVEIGLIVSEDIVFQGPGSPRVPHFSRLLREVGISGVITLPDAPATPAESFYYKDRKSTRLN